jgi:shikimate dehydrogenase
MMQISGTTKLLGLIGSPVAHSKSPAMYNYCFQKFGLDYAYLAFDIPLERTGEAVQAVRTLNMRGANVTMPSKNAVLPYLDELTPAAQVIQAVNTIVNENGRLVGHNTDGCGYTQNLRRNGVEIQGKRLVMMGGGGVASAVAGQSALEGAAEITVFNQRDAFWPRMEQLLSRIAEVAPACKISLHDLADRSALKKAIDDCDILSNATPVGMAPRVEETNLPETQWLRPDLVVSDVVYSPAETRLLRAAKAAGCRTADGLGMLLCQGAEAFRLYSGMEMPVEEIRALLYQ